MKPHHLLLASMLLVACTSSEARKFDGWSTGRATFYGNNDGMSIHIGSCMFGNIDGSQGTGWDIAAISDKAHDYAGSCGRCYEVACRPTTIRDGYGNSIDRSNACNGEESVIVTITDTCPCYYPSNQYSNTRWCCGDDYHMDLSYWAFKKLASTGQGAIGIYYRQVPCPGSSSGSSSSSRSSSSSSGSSSSSESSYASASSFSSSSSSSHSSSYSYSSSSGGSDGDAWWLDMSRSDSHRNHEWRNRGLRKVLSWF